VDVERGTLSRHQKVDLKVDFDRRQAIESNHTATHLLHAALRQVVGQSARQAGSLVAPDRLRFDFTYHRGLLEPEVQKVEDLVNEWIRRAVPTDFRFRSYQEAVAAGAMALFGEKYGDTVRTVEVQGLSTELCGGCHVANSGEIGLFLIESERGIASGVRRIEAVTGAGALATVRAQRIAYDGLIETLGIKSADPAQQRERAGQLKTRMAELENEVKKLRLQLVSGGSGKGAAAADDETIEVLGVKVLAREVPSAPADDLRAMADALRAKLGSGVVILGARDEGNVSLIAAVTKDLVERVKAGELVKKLSGFIGGRGGGRPDFAQAGGKQPENLPAALAAAGDAVREQLGG
jgi:alanyl-tRNA synthetase